MNTLGEKVIRFPWAAARMLPAWFCSQARSRSINPAPLDVDGGGDGDGRDRHRFRLRGRRQLLRRGAGVGRHRRHLIGGVQAGDRGEVGPLVPAQAGRAVSPAASPSTSHTMRSATTWVAGRSSPATTAAKARRLADPDTVKTANRARAMAG